MADVSNYLLLKRWSRGVGGYADHLELVGKIVRSQMVGRELLELSTEFQLLAEHPPQNTKIRSAVKNLIIKRAANYTHARLDNCVPKSLWGVTPIISIITNCASDRLSGINAETIVYKPYYITAQFDINLSQQWDWIILNAPECIGAYQWMIFFWAVNTYDIFHYFNDRGLLGDIGGYGSVRFGISLEEMEILQKAGKNLYTYTYGADSRLRLATMAQGDFNLCMNCPEIGKYCLCDDVGGSKMLAEIGRYATAMVTTGLAMQIIPNARNLYYLVVDMNDPKFLTATRQEESRAGKFRIAHATNHGFFKGSDRLSTAVRNIQHSGGEIELVALTGVPNEEVLRLMMKCDVVADQFISGSFGYTTIEAMALGKPVLCYLDPTLDFPDKKSLPIINCHPENIENKLRELMASRDNLVEIGKRSRAYVSKHYSTEALSKRLSTMYVETGKFPLKLRSNLERSENSIVQDIKETSLTANLSETIQRIVDYCELVCALTGLKGMNFLSKLASKVKSIKYLPKRILLKAVRVGVDLLLETCATIGGFLSRRRVAQGRIRSVWGVTPIVTLPLLARCDQMLGIQSKSLVLGTYYTASDFDLNFDKVIKLITKWTPSLLDSSLKIILAWAILRYDMFHYFYDRGILSPNNHRIGVNSQELRILKKAGKTTFYYAYGADVRTQQTTLEFGEINICRNCPKPMTYCVCSDEIGAKNIKNIEKYATGLVAMGDMVPYVKAARNQYYWPVDVANISEKKVAYRIGNPLRIAHVPNHEHFKGTSLLKSAVEKLVEDGYSVELIYAQGVPHSRVMEIYESSDIVADQFVAGFHGYAALEAMAIGRAVICYIRSDDMLLEPKLCPIIRVEPNSIYDTLKSILIGDIDIVSIGVKSRAYIEKFHSIEAVAKRQGNMYLQLMDMSPKLTKTTLKYMRFLG